METNTMNRKALVFNIKRFIEMNPDAQILIVIDGDAASGKSTFGLQLAERFNAHLVHIDGFYLPFEQRLDCNACHMDIDRLLDTVVIPFKSNAILEYVAFDPHQNRIIEKHTVENQRILIIDGSYSFHPGIRPYVDVSIAMQVREDVQMQRIIERSNRAVYERFKNIWILKEKSYQHDTDLFSSVNYRIENSI